MDRNYSEEEAIFLNRTHPSMVQINTIAYALELIYYSMALVFVPAYIALSNFARRFHPLLRIQLRVFLVEVLIITVTREVGVIFRLIEGASVHLPAPFTLLRDLLTIVNLAVVNDVDMTVFLIAMERLLATYRVKTYENEYRLTCCHRLLVLFAVVIVPNALAVLLLLVLVDSYLILSIWNYVTTVTHFLGLVAMETSRILSVRQLRSEDRQLTTSFQCKENIMVVHMFRPIFILFFISRLVQFGSKWFMFAEQFKYGAVAMRIATHLYNQSVGICFLFVPLILLKNHNNLTRFTRQSAVFQEASGDLYFKTLLDKWQTP